MKKYFNGRKHAVLNKIPTMMCLGEEKKKKKKEKKPHNDVLGKEKTNKQTKTQKTKQQPTMMCLGKK